MSVRCSQGHNNPDNATFCDECGEPLPAALVNPVEDESAAGLSASSPEPAADLDATLKATNPPIAADAGETQAARPAPPAAKDEGATIPDTSAPATPGDQEAVAAAPGAAPSMPAAEPSMPAAAPSAPEAVPSMPAAMPSAPVPAAAAAPAQPHLVVEGAEATFDLVGKTVIVIGREDPPSNSFPDWDLTPYGAEEGGVSRLHARLTQSGDVWSIEDLESTNFTFINRKRIPAKTPMPLADGDEVRLGRVGLHFKTTA